MVTKYIDIDEKWGILLNYNFGILDWDDMAATMSAFGMNDRNINKSLNILSQYNTGMSISNDGLRMTSIYIGKPTSNAQFWDTVNHELMHAEQAILNYYGVDWNGEPSAYLAGYLLKRVVEEIAEPCYN